MPSGVITAMPFCTPLPVPRSIRTTRPFDPVVLPMTCAATRLRCRLFLEDGQRLAALGCIELGPKKLVLHLDAVQVGLQALVLLAHVEQHEVIA